MGRDPARGQLLFMDHLLHATLDTHVEMLQREVVKNMDLGPNFGFKSGGWFLICGLADIVKFFLPPLISSKQWE